MTFILPLLIGCGSDPPPKPKPPSEPVEEPEPERTTQMLRLDPGERADLRQHAPAEWAAIADIDGLIEHPEGEKIERYAVTPFADEYLAIAFDEGKTWTVSADLNQDGQIRGGEFVDLEEAGDGSLKGQLRTAVKRGPPVVDVPITIEVGVTGDKKARVFTTRIESTVHGALPEGTKFHAQSFGGVFDTPQTRITLDLDGDDTADAGNRFSQFPRAANLIFEGEEIWRYELPADGGYLRLDPTDATEIPGLVRAGNDAPDFSLTTHDGETHALESLVGKKVVLAFFDTSCSPCTEKQADLMKLAEAHELTVLGVAADPPDAAAGWKRKPPAPFPTAAVGRDSEIHQSYDVARWPTYVFIDDAGKLAAFGSFDVLKAALD